MGDYKIGTTLLGMTALGSLPEPVDDGPIISDVLYDRQKLGNGQYQEIGLGKCTWKWPLLTYAQLAQLRSFCSGASASVFIRTVPDKSAPITYANYSAVMVWPEKDPEMKAGLVYDFVLTFESMEAAS